MSQLKTSNVENFRDFLKLFPPVKQLIRMIPSTLPLLDIIITKSLKNWEKHIRSILTAIKLDSPSILEAARDVELCLADSLEALGCHGLINCSEGLIRLLDAICLEVSNHQKKLKQVAKQLRNLKISKSEFEASSAASHHRHVNLHLSQLSSLLRIVCRRVICDQTLIKLYKVLMNSAPSDYAISETDPIVADVIATFNMAYHRLLSLSSVNHHQFNECPNSNKYISETSHEEDLAQYRLLLSTSDTDTETDPSCTDLASSNSQIAIASSFGKVLHISY
ncbi:unnamed protein product [Brugia pahangi]|uniref:Uncharacterized protein n=1 Tax=Brugia pahangi TaxID=6280 RepID=A0A0N4T7Q1_BRUPA|nr:unnamed protein product [Brugia pahangi]